MKRGRRRSWWLRFWSGVGVAAIAMAGVSAMALHMERRAISAQQKANRQGLLRLALWRMDSWLAPRLGREAARPYYEYLPYYANRDAYTKYYGRIEVGDVVSPSPLLTFQSDFFPLHFQVDANGRFSSPQIPTDNALDLASYQFGLSPEQIAARQQTLSRIEQHLGRVDLAAACEAGAVLVNQPITPPAEIAQIESELAQKKRATFEDDAVQTIVNWQDRSRRGATSNEVQQDVLQQQSSTMLQVEEQAGGSLDPTAMQADAVDVGPLVPLWLNVEGEATTSSEQLYFVRRVRNADGESFQGVAADWAALREAMIEQASDLLPDVDLEPQPVAELDAAQSVWMLATIPAVLKSSSTLPYESPLITPARSTLALAWLGLIGGCVAVGLTLRSTIDYADRRDQFASAVTHELRTPMTTFRMYSEMLADGMVEDESQRAAYHRTLRDESIRFGAMIENMLSYARVEEGRAPIRIERLTPAQLAERLRPGLTRRGEQDGVSIQMKVSSDDRPCAIDPGAIEQIVFNLVDNACKYGRSEALVPIHVVIEADEEHLTVRVCDSGPGVSEAMRERIFEPFDRGHVEPGSETSGVGIGLALSRGLALAMGGSLHAEAASESEGGGLCVVLRIPRGV